MTTPELYIGIDLHSNNLYAAVVDAHGKRVRHARLLCELYEVEKWLSKLPRRPALIAIESTYNWYWLVDGLREAGYEVRLANPAGFKPYSGMKHVDDKSDAFFIAELSRLGILPCGFILDPGVRSVRDLLRRRSKLVGKRTSLLLSLRNLQMRTLGRAIKSKEIQNSKASDLMAAFDDPHDKLSVELQKSLIDTLGASIRTIESAVLGKAAEMPRFEALLTVPGIGKILAMTIVLEVGEIGRFASAEDFASYCRTVRSSRTSNGKKKGENNRKCGNRYLCWAFIEAANFIVRYDASARRWFDRKMSKTSRVVATKALACKLSKLCWHLLREEGGAYDAERIFGPSAQKQISGSTPQPPKGVETK